jgi:hypothetical protein
MGRRETNAHPICDCGSRMRKVMLRLLFHLFLLRTQVFQAIGRPLVLISSGDGEDGDSEWKTQVSQEKTFRAEEVEQHGI